LLTLGSDIVGFLSFNLGTTLVLKSAFSTEKRGYSSLALRFLDFAQERHCSLPGLAYWRGQAYSKMGRRQSALDAWRASPDADYWLTLQGRSEIAQHQYDTALSTFEMAALVNPSSSTIHYYGGLALHQLDRYEQALVWYNAALELSDFDKRFIEPVSELDGGRWWHGDPGDERLSPTKAHTYVQISGVYYQLGQWNLMRDAAQKAVDLAPHDPLGYFQLGGAYFYLAQADNIDPESKARFYRLAEEALVTVVDQVAWNQAPFFQTLARVYRGQGKTSAAADAYQRMLRTSSPPAAHFYEVASFYVSAGQPQEAIPLYDVALSKTPEKPKFAHRWVEAAEAWAAAGKEEEACDLFRRGLDICGEAENKDCAAENSILWDICSEQR
jgi:tetratricopeptide (TPR) repeat protein